jgi:hypothetical protein
MKKLITICLVVVTILAVCVPVQATPVLTTTLANLLQGQTIISGDKLFSDFHGWETTSVNPAAILVSAYQDPTNGEFGLKFTSDDLFLSSGGGLTAQFDFLVQPTIAGNLISDNTLTMTGSGNGVIYLSETATDARDESIQLAFKNNYIMGMGTVQKLYDHEEYTVPTQIVHVSKYIQIDWAGSTAPGPRLTEFTQTFSQIPEPATICMLGLGALSLIRRKK